MILRRFTALLAALGLVLAFGATATAQDDGVTVTINLVTCAVTGSADSATIASSPEASAGAGRDCVEAYPEDAATWITLDGEGPTSSTATSLTWEGVADGEHVASPGLGQSGEEFTFTVAGEDVTLWATYFAHVVGEDPAAEPEEPDAEESPAGSDDTDADADAEGDADEGSAAEDAAGTAEDDAAPSSLPNTGSGPGPDAGMTVVAALAIMAGLFALAARLVGDRR
jgi:hypothetical protein